MIEPTYLITAAVERGTVPTPESEIRWCSICACAIWLSPAALRKLDDEPRIQATCVECGIGVMADHGEVVQQALEPSRDAVKIMRAINQAVKDVHKARRGR